MPGPFQSRPVTQPVLWMPQNEIANSPSNPVQLTQGPFAGQLLAARTAYTAAFTRLPDDPASPLREVMRPRLLERQMAVAAALRDRDATLQWARMRLAESEIPDLLLERMQSDAALTALLGEATWTALLAETRAARP